MIRAVLFDFDGTLAHFTGDYALFVAGFRSELNLEQCDMNTFAEHLAFEERREGPVTLRRSLENTLAALEQRLPGDLGALTTKAIADYAAQVEPLPGAVEVLEFFVKPMTCRWRSSPTRTPTVRGL